MIILQDTNDSVEILLGGAVTTNQLPFYAAWTDTTTSSFTPGQTNGTTNNASAVTVVSAPGASTTRT